MQMPYTNKIFDQINAVFVSIRDFLQNFKNSHLQTFELNIQI